MPLDPTKTSKTLDVAKTVVLTGDAVVGEVLSPKTFYKDDPDTKLTGTMPTVAIVAANDDYPAGYHAGNVGGLDAIDADLAPANIKSGVTIFGKLGTYLPTLADDIVNNARRAGDAGAILGFAFQDIFVSGETTVDLVSINETYAAGSRCVAHGFGYFNAYTYTDSVKISLYMNGTQKAESAYITTPDLIVLQGSAVLSGSKICKVSVHNYRVEDDAVRLPNFSTTRQAVGIAVGSIKI